VRALIDRARDGDISLRAECLTAHRVHVLRLAAGHDEEATDEAEAGGILEAYAAHEIHDLREMYFATHRKA